MAVAVTQGTSQEEARTGSGIAVKAVLKRLRVEATSQNDAEATSQNDAEAHADTPFLRFADDDDDDDEILDENSPVSKAGTLGPRGRRRGRRRATGEADGPGAAAPRAGRSLPPRAFGRFLAPVRDRHRFSSAYSWRHFSSYQGSTPSPRLFSLH